MTEQQARAILENYREVDENTGEKYRHNIIRFLSCDSDRCIFECKSNGYLDLNTGNFVENANTTYEVTVYPDGMSFVFLSNFTSTSTGKTYQDVTALRDPLAGLTGGTENPFDSSAVESTPTADYSPSQPRDEHGKWTDEGGNTEYPERTDLPQIPNFNPLSENQVVDVLQKEAQPWIENLSDAERIAFEKYTFNPGDKKPDRFFERLNRMLRGAAEEDSILSEYAERISGALKRSTLHPSLKQEH